MALFVVLGRFTDQGLRNIKEYPSLSKTAGQTDGVKGDLYVTQGRYDLVGLLECPSQEAALRLIAQSSQQGNVRWETMPAVSIERFEELMATSVEQSSQPNVRLFEGKQTEHGHWKT